jgi:hypothetical protein
MARAPIADALPPAAQAGVTQAAASMLAILPLAAGLEVTVAQWAVVHGAIALRIATLAKAERWWPPLHLVVAPALVGAALLEVPPWVWGGAFSPSQRFSAARSARRCRCSSPAAACAPTRRLARRRSQSALSRSRLRARGVIAALKRQRPECEFSWRRARAHSLPREPLARRAGGLPGGAARSDGRRSRTLRRGLCISLPGAHAGVVGQAKRKCAQAACS